MNVIAFFIMYFFVYQTILCNSNSNTLFFKTLSSICFLVCAFLSYKKSPINKKYFYIIITSLLFGLIGDIFLAPPYTNSRFCFGAISFAIGHVLYAIAFLITTSINLKNFLFTGVMSGSIIFFITHNSSFNLEGKLAVACIYSILVSFMFATSLNILKFRKINSFFCYFTILGAFLFLASDIVLTFKLFVTNPNPCFDAINLILYYTGQGLIALSLSDTNLSSPKTRSNTSNNYSK